MSDGPDVPESAVDHPSQQSMQLQSLKRVVALTATNSLHTSILTTQSPFDNYPESSLPFPLNLPPSYPVYRGQALAPLQRQPSTIPSQNALSTPGRAGKDVSRTTTSAVAESTTRPASILSSSKGKRSLDAFMQSRQAAQSQTESSDSDSDTSLRKVLVNRWQSLHSSESARVLSSSPPSSSPVQTPRESSPIYPSFSGDLIGFPPSPSPRPKRQVTANARAGPSNASTSLNDVPYTLPPGPYLEERPFWSLAALIGQSIAASFAGALPLNDIYTYISTVYPYFDRRDQAWMSSIRHSLSVNEAFERVYDQDGTAAKKVKCKGKTRLKGGFWRIRPGYEDCFIGGNFVRKGAKGAGPGMNPSSSRKRTREEDGSHRSQKAKTTGRGASHNRTNSNIEKTVTERLNSRMRSKSSPEPVVRKLSSPPSSSPPSLSASQSTHPSDSLPSDICDNNILPFEQDSPDSQSQRKYQWDTTNILAKLEAGFELQCSPSITDRDEPVKIISPRDILSSRVPHPSSSSPKSYLSFVLDTPSRCRTPPPLPLTPSRTPISYKGIQMSPTVSLAHYKNSLEPEWKVVLQPSTPPAGGSNPAPFATPQRLLFPRPSRSPSKHYDPYDPETLLADELATMRKSRELGESPGGIFGKEGRKLLYESPSIPGKSDWRFTSDEF